MLDRDGKPIRGTSINSIYSLAFIAYFVVLVWKTGRTPGARVMGTRVVDITTPGTAGVPLGKTIIRYLALMIGAVPAFALLLYTWLGSAEAPMRCSPHSFFHWFAYAVGLAVCGAVVLSVQVALKTDPIYDRLAGTAVLRA